MRRLCSIANKKLMRACRMKKSGIYHIVNKINGKIYVGSAMDLRQRKNAHFSELRRQVHRNQILQRAYNKYGENNFKFKIVALCPMEYLIKLEQWFIDNCSSKYNIAPKAGNCFGKHHSKETKKKIGDKKRGLKQTDKTIGLRVEKTSKPVFQYDLNGIYVTSFSSIAEAGRQIGGVIKPDIGRVARTEKGTALKYQWRFYKINKIRETVINQQRPVICKNLKGEVLCEYKNVSSAARALNAQVSNVTSCLKGRLKTSAGYKFEYRNN